MVTTNNATMFNEDCIDELKKNVDHLYLLTNAIFVCLMQCGFACLEAGSVRAKNVTNIIMKNVLDIFISCVAYWMVGYAVAYGRGNPFMGLTYWAGIGIPRNKYSHWFFQFVFAATAATIVSGAVAERCHFVAYLVYSAIISGFIYPIVSHWIWAENGWLFSVGYSDFAGSGAVHLLGGTCALVAAKFLGPRIGRFEGLEMPGHSIPLVGIGGMILITGFLAFNGGSLGYIANTNAGSTVSVVIVNTVLGGAGAAGITLIAGRAGFAGPRSWNFCLTLNGALTGMVSVCAAVNTLQFWSSFLVGAIGGFVYLSVHHIIPLCKVTIRSIFICGPPELVLIHKTFHTPDMTTRSIYKSPFFTVDDPLDAVAVHLGGGFWGVIAGPIFKENGILFDQGKENILGVLYNAIGGLAIFCWSLITCGIMFGGLKWVNCLRVSREDELRGLDISKHNLDAYPSAGWNDINNSFRNRRNRQCKCEINGKDHDSKTPATQEYANHSYEDDNLSP